MSDGPDLDRPDLESVHDLESVYDAATIAALDAWTPGRDPDGPTRRSWRGLTAGLALNAMVLGVGDALGDAPANEAIVELRPAVDADELGPVTVILVPGAPRASRVIVRPWLLAG